MTEDFFMRLCDVYGFAPSRALRELVDAAIGQAVVAERYKAARLADPVQEPVAYSVGRTLHWHQGCGVTDAQLYTATANILGPNPDSSQDTGHAP